MTEYEMVEESECAHCHARRGPADKGSNWNSDKAPTLTYVYLLLLSLI